MVFKKGKIKTAMQAKSGQALIAILLVMAISLTLGVSVAGRTISTLRQITFSAQSAEALAFAEAGVEEALNDRCGTSGCTNTIGITRDINGDGINDVTYTVADLSGAVVSYPLLERDNTIEIRLVGYGNSSVNVYWDDSSSCAQDKDSGIEFSVIFSAGSNYSLTKTAYDTVARGNGLPLVSCSSYSVGGTTYRYLQTVSGLPANKIALRIRILYATAPVGIAIQGVGGATLPVQADIIESTGTSGATKRKVEVIRSLPALSGLFDHAVFSGSTTQPLSR